MLSRFAGVVPGPTLYKAYRVAIEPIALYDTEVIYENLSTITLKKFNHLEFTAIKTSYKLPRTTPVSKLLPYLELEGIANRIETRRNNFVKKNSNSTIIRHGETLTFSQGRRIRVKTTHRDRSVGKNSWKTPLHNHKPHLFFSDLSENYNISTDSASISISKSLHPENFNSLPTQPTRHTIQHIPTIKFNTVPALKRGKLFIPSSSVADSILRRTKQSTNKTKHKRTLKKKTNRILLSPLPHHTTNAAGNHSCRRELFDPG